MRQFYGRLEKCVLSAGKTHVHKIPRFRGRGILGFGGGGGSADFIFMGARIFLIKCLCWLLFFFDWAAPTLSYLWPTRTELSRKVSENQKFLGRNISVIYLSPKLPRHGNSDHLVDFKERVFFTSHFCDLYRSCAASRKSFLRLHF